MVIKRKLLTKPLNILDGKLLRNLYCFSIKCFTIIFKHGRGGEELDQKCVQGTVTFMEAKEMARNVLT